MRFFLSIMLVTSASAAVDFETEIQPIFENKCYKCHGEDKQKGGVALHKKHLAFKEADAGEPVIKAGDETSLILEVVEEEDEDFRMPPFPKQPLEASEIAKLKQWIKEGANWPGEEEQEELAAQANPPRSAPPARATTRADRRREEDAVAAELEEEAEPAQPAPPDVDAHPEPVRQLTQPAPFLPWAVGRNCGRVPETIA